MSKAIRIALKDEDKNIIQAYWMPVSMKQKLLDLDIKLDRDFDIQQFIDMIMIAFCSGKVKQIINTDNVKETASIKQLSLAVSESLIQNASYACIETVVHY